MDDQGAARGNRIREDLKLLCATVDLCRIPVPVPAARAFQAVYGHLPLPADMRRLRRAIGRLVRDGLVQAAVSLDLVPTPDGRTAVEILRTAREVKPPLREAG